MDDSDTDYEDLNKPITMINYMQRRFGCDIIKEEASENGKLDRNLINNKKCANASKKSNSHCSSLKQRYKCCTVSIKLVDCAKFPWYYKFNQKVKLPENNVDIKKNQEEADKVSSESDVDDLICLDPICAKHKVMHNTNAHILRYKQSAKEGCLFYQKQFSEKMLTNDKSIVNGQSQTHACLGVDFKKNIGLIGMRVRHRICTNNLKQTSDGHTNYKALSKTINTKGRETKTILKIIRDKTEPRQLNLKGKMSMNKVTSLIRNDNNNYISHSKVKNSFSPVLKLNIKIKKEKNHSTKPIINVTENKNRDTTFLSNCLEMKQDEEYFKDCKFNQFNATIGKNVKSPILKSNVENSKVLSAIELRSKSPILLCKNNMNTKISISNPREVSNDCHSGAKHDKNNLYCLKGDVAKKQNSALQNKQVQVNILNEGNKNIKLPVSSKLNHIVENLCERKLPQKDTNIGNKETNLGEEIPQPKNCINNFVDIRKFNTKTSHETYCKDKSNTCNLSFTINHIKSCNSPVLLSQHQRSSLRNVKQRTRHEKTSIPYSFEGGYQNLLQAALIPGSMVRHQIPHKHVCIPAASSVLLKSTNHQILPCTYTSKQIFPWDHKDNTSEETKETEMLEECITNPRISTSKEIVTEPTSNMFLQNNVQRAEDKCDNVLLDQNMKRSGYSPPILPIPTYQATFEYFASLSSGDVIPLAQYINDFRNQKILDPISTTCCEYYNADYSGWKDSMENRKLNSENSLKKTRIKELGPVIKSKK